MQDVMHVSKEELKELKWREENGNIAELMAIEVGNILSLKNHITCLITKGVFLSEVRKLRHNIIIFAIIIVKDC